MFEKNNIIEFLYPKDQKKILEDVFPIPTKLNLPDWFKKLKYTIKDQCKNKSCKNQEIHSFSHYSSSSDLFCSRILSNGRYIKLLPPSTSINTLVELLYKPCNASR